MLEWRRSKTFFVWLAFFQQTLHASVFRFKTFQSEIRTRRKPNLWSWPFSWFDAFIFFRQRRGLRIKRGRKCRFALLRFYCCSLDWLEIIGRDNSNSGDFEILALNHFPIWRYYRNWKTKKSHSPILLFYTFVMTCPFSLEQVRTGIIASKFHTSPSFISRESDLIRRSEKVDEILRLGFITPEPKTMA